MESGRSRYQKADQSIYGRPLIRAYESYINAILAHEVFYSRGIDGNSYTANLKSLYSSSAILKNALKSKFSNMQQFCSGKSKYITS